MQKIAAKPRKEALFVQVPVPDGGLEFHDLTRFVGKPMPFSNPKETCAMRVSPSAVAFALLHLTKKTASTLAAKPVEMPRGPLVRLERRASELAATLEPDRVIAEMDGTVEEYIIERDTNGVVELISLADDFGFELPKGAVKLSLFLRSPNVDRIIAVGFIGHPGRPGTDDTLRRIASKALYSMSHLPQFRVLTDIETVSVPAPPRTVNKFVRKADQKATAGVPLYLFTEGSPPLPAGNGTVHVEIDLDSANHTTSRLLFHFTPDASIAEQFDAYRAILDSTLTTLLRQHLGEDDVKAITVDIVLGEVGIGTIERLKEALAVAAVGLDLTPSMYQLHA